MIDFGNFVSKISIKVDDERKWFACSELLEGYGYTWNSNAEHVFQCLDTLRDGESYFIILTKYNYSLSWSEGSKYWDVGNEGVLLVDWSEDLDLNMFMVANNLGLL